jgi:HlyD family secretion protein
MLKRKLLFFQAVIIAIVIGSYLLFGSTSDKSAQFKFVSLTRGNLESTISSTGTLSPVTQVEVGTQVSGTVDKILVDFNDKVKKGEIIAVIDTMLLKLSVTDAQAGSLKAEAQLEEAEKNYKRSNGLTQKGMLSEADFQSVKTALKNAQANMVSAQSALERAEQNLKYAIIRSPIDGTVTARNVEAGQTVAASFSTPTLFTIAQDLSKMEIKALVDESDIGQIKEGQAVRFSVQAYPKRKFEGRVKQVRVQPTTNSNVVNYTVVISADNTDNVLLPGMTATVDFIIAQKTNVLLVPNSALRYQPSDDQLKEARQRISHKLGVRPDTSKRDFTQLPKTGKSSPEFAALKIDSPESSETRRLLWYIDNDGALAMAPVRVGSTDGTNTEIVGGGILTVGKQVISGTTLPAKSASKTASNKIQPGPPPF